MSSIKLNFLFLQNDNDANDNVVEVTNIESGCKIDETGENVKLYYFCY